MKTERNIDLLKYIYLLAIFFIYSLIALLSKFASSTVFMSNKFLLCLVLIFVVMATYAIFWQQIIKSMPISKAYAFKGAVIVYNLFWAFLIFKETITITNIIGSLFIILGIWVVNKDAV